MSSFNFRVRLNTETEGTIEREIDSYVQAYEDTVRRLHEMKLPMAYGICAETAEYMAKLLNQQGISVYYVEGRCRDVDHAWLQTEEGRILDPSGTLFYPKLSLEEYRVPEDDDTAIVFYTPQKPVDFETALDRCTCENPEVFIDPSVPIDLEDPYEGEVVAFSCRSCRKHIRSYMKQGPNPTKGGIQVVFGMQPSLRPCHECGEEPDYYVQYPRTERDGGIARMFYCETHLTSILFHTPAFIFVNPDVFPHHAWCEGRLFSKGDFTDVVSHAKWFLHRSENAYALYFPRGNKDLQPIRVSLRDDWREFESYCRNIVEYLENDLPYPTTDVQSSLLKFFE